MSTALRVWMAMLALLGAVCKTNAQLPKCGAVASGAQSGTAVASLPNPALDCRADLFLGTSGTPSRIASADLNSDGNADIVVTDPDNARLRVVINSIIDLPGRFVIGPDSATLATPYALSIADVDMDGDLDVATAAFGPGAICVSFNDGFASLQLTHVLPVVHQTNSAILFDLDADGDVDAAGSSF